MNELLKNFFGKAGDFIQGVGFVNKITVNSSLNPLLWFVALLLIFVFFSPLVGLSMEIVFIIVKLVVILFFVLIVCYLYFMFKNPDCLRSETYLTKRLQIEAMGQKNKEISATIIEGSLNTQNTKLLKPGKKNK